MTTNKTRQVGWVSDEEMKVIFEKRCQQLLGIKGTTFLRNLGAGKYKTFDENTHNAVVELSMLAPRRKR
jgi:hypothetical protein